MRRIDYLRLSVTDRCNLRCSYCLPAQGFKFLPQREILRFEEVLRIVRILVSLGVKRIRFTGGEPLVRKKVMDLIAKVRAVEGVEEVFLTTNGIRLKDYLQGLKAVDVKGINISLDTLKKERYKLITGRDALDCVLEAIREAKKIGFNSLKVNTVLMYRVNDDEIIDFVKFAEKEKVIVRFIEFMPISPLWENKQFLPIEEIQNICRRYFTLRSMDYPKSGPAQYYTTDKAVIGFIKTSVNNCRLCSRLRLTAFGELKLCLYQDKGLNLKRLLREGKSDLYLSSAIERFLDCKETLDYRHWKKVKTYMCELGG